MASSPWGKIQISVQFARGLRLVSTARHGGFMATERWAKKNLTAAARLVGRQWNGYYAFEEDCAADVVLWEWFVFLGHKSTPTPLHLGGRVWSDNLERSLVRSLSRWNPLYLRAAMDEYAARCDAVRARPEKDTKPVAVSSTKQQTVWPEPLEEPPTMQMLNDWMFDVSLPEATDGCIVEPDGVCPHGYPSWILYLGYI